MPTTMTLRMLVGAALLLLGRKLFWLFVGALGFLYGFKLAAMFLKGQPEFVLLIFAVALGIVGALLAPLFQRFAIAIVGFLAGGQFVMGLVPLLHLRASDPIALFFIFGGVSGAILVSLFFDWALILLSSINGAMLMTQGLLLPEAQHALLFVVLAIVGVIVQSGMMLHRGEV